VALKDAATVEVPLAKAGENVFKIFAFDAAGSPLPLATSRVVITKTAATVDAIPASHSIGMEVADRRGGRAGLLWLVRAGDPLPRRGVLKLRAAESLRAESDGSINLKLWEGEIEDRVSDNRFIGTMKIRGTDLDSGVIQAEAEILCQYEVADSGAVTLEVSVPSVGAAFHSGRNFYSPQDGQLDYSSDTEQIVAESEQTKSRVDELAGRVDDPKLEEAREKLASASEVSAERSSPEAAKQAMDNVLEARRLLAQVRRDHQKEIRQIALEGLKESFKNSVEKYARPTELTTIENLFKTAQRAIDRADRDFENIVDELHGRRFEILWRQDWFVVDWFKFMATRPAMFADRKHAQELVKRGIAALEADDIDRVRTVVRELGSIQISSGDEDQMFDVANVLRG
jgi:molecular chaperone DnaK